jgi:uncharacterized lipoprotein YddW (UPF0748 family)
MRGIWVTRWSYSSTSDIATIMGEVADAGFNTVYFQVRGNHDAYYDSSLEPWASRLSGTLGVDPGWDPLQSAIDEGHARGLQVHAYINVAPLWSGTTAPSSSGIAHAYTSNPEWVVADSSGTPLALNGSYVYATLGNSLVRGRLADVAADISNKYDVDGIHLDYIRYPGSDYSHDTASEASYALSPDGLSWEDWQREQVKLAVGGVSDAVDVPVTAAVWGIYENSFGWSGVSQGNTDYYQDSRAFLSEGLLDANIPMIYWPVTDVPGDYLDFATLAQDHVDHASGRHVYAGMSAEDLDVDQLVACVEAARTAGANGVVMFDWSTARSMLKEFGARVFKEPKEPPSMPWRE